MIFLLFSVIGFASFWDRFREVFWLVFGSAFGAFGGQEAAKMSSKNRCENWHRKKEVPRRPGSQKLSLAGARRGVRGEEVRKKGRKEEKKKGSR